LRQGIGLFLDRINVVGLDRFLQRGGGGLDGGLLVATDLVAMFAKRLFRGMDQRVGLVAGLDQLAPLLVFRGMGFSVLDHLLDVGFRQATAGLDADLLLLAGGLVFGGDADDAVGVDVE